VDLQGIGKIVALMGLALIGARADAVARRPPRPRLAPRGPAHHQRELGMLRPLASMIVLSIVLTIVVNVVLRLFDR
jgi:hypothetical protein